jgi:uncharacterized membrane protein
LVEWLRENVEGSPIIVEAIAPIYHWTGRFSQYTGLPAVIGWDWHQTQQRWGYAGEVSERRLDTQRFWGDPDPEQALAYLRKYNVSYVVVGTEEVAMYPQGLAKFRDMEGLTPVFERGQYVIYRVDQSKMPVPSFETVTIDGETSTTARPIGASPTSP